MGCLYRFVCSFYSLVVPNSPRMGSLKPPAIKAQQCQHKYENTYQTKSLSILPESMGTWSPFSSEILEECNEFIMFCFAVGLICDELFLQEIKKNIKSLIESRPLDKLNVFQNIVSQSLVDLSQLRKSFGYVAINMRPAHYPCPRISEDLSSSIRDFLCSITHPILGDDVHVLEEPVGLCPGLDIFMGGQHAVSSKEFSSRS